VALGRTCTTCIRSKLNCRGNRRRRCLRRNKRSWQGKADSKIPNSDTYLNYSLHILRMRSRSGTPLVRISTPRSPIAISTFKITADIFPAATTTTTTTTPTAITAVTTIPTTTTTPAVLVHWRPCSSFVHPKRSSVDLRLIHGFHCVIGIVLVFERHEGKSAALPRAVVLRNVDIFDFAKLSKHFLQILLSRLEVKIAHVKLAMLNVALSGTRPRLSFSGGFLA